MSNAEIVFSVIVVVLTLLIVALLISPDLKNSFKLFKEDKDD